MGRSLGEVVIVDVHDVAADSLTRDIYYIFLKYNWSSGMIETNKQSHSYPIAAALNRRVQQILLNL